jgi:CRISPR-associated protein Cmr2
VRAAQRPDGGEQGYRCDLTGEAEWLTHDLAHLSIPKGERKHADTLWNRAISKRPGLSRKGEHLGALAMLKRLWSRWFVEHELGKCDIDVRRFVVSTTPWRCPPRWALASKARRSATPAASCW